MKTHTLTRTGYPPLRFQGELVAEADTELLQALRWYKAQIYRSEAGKLVVSVGFRSNWEGEAEHDWVTVCDTPAQVAEALRAYDVLPPGRGYPPSDQYKDRQEKLRSHLQRDYDTMISDLLDSDLFVETLDDTTADEDYLQEDWKIVDAYLRTTLASIPLTREEACAVCDANPGAMMTSCPWASVVPNLMSSDGLDEKWAIDTVVLVRKLKFLSTGELLAVAFGAARFWRNAKLPTDDALKKAGFGY